MDHLSPQAALHSARQITHQTTPQTTHQSFSQSATHSTTRVTRQAILACKTVKEATETLQAGAPDTGALVLYIRNVLRKDNDLSVDYFYAWWKSASPEARVSAHQIVKDLAHVGSGTYLGMCMRLQSDVLLTPPPLETASTNEEQLQIEQANAAVTSMSQSGELDDQQQLGTAAERQWVHMCIDLGVRLFGENSMGLVRRRVENLTQTINGLPTGDVRLPDLMMELMFITQAGSEQALGWLLTDVGMFHAYALMCQSVLECVSMCGANAIPCLPLETIVSTLNLTNVLNRAHKALLVMREEDSVIGLTNDVREELLAVHRNPCRIRGLFLLAADINSVVPKHVRQMALELVPRSLDTTDLLKIPDLTWLLANIHVKLAPHASVLVSTWICKVLTADLATDALPIDTLPLSDRPFFVSRLVLSTLRVAILTRQYYTTVNNNKRVQEIMSRRRYERNAVLREARKHALLKEYPDALQKTLNLAQAVIAGATGPLNYAHNCCVLVMRAALKWDQENMVLPSVFWTFIDALPGIAQHCGSGLLDVLIQDILRHVPAQNEFLRYLKLCDATELGIVGKYIPSIYALNVKPIPDDDLPYDVSIDSIRCTRTYHPVRFQSQSKQTADQPIVSLESLLCLCLEKGEVINPFTNMAVTWADLLSINPIIKLK